MVKKHSMIHLPQDILPIYGFMDCDIKIDLYKDMVQKR